MGWDLPIWETLQDSSYTVDLFRKAECWSFLWRPWRTWSVWDHHQSEDCSRKGTQDGMTENLLTKPIKNNIETVLMLNGNNIDLFQNPNLSFQQVKWIRILYSDFSTFTKDQELLISSEKTFDYIEGSVIINKTGILNTWRSSFHPQNRLQASHFSSDGRILFCLELTKNFDPDETDITNQVIEWPTALVPQEMHAWHALQNQEFQI